MNRKAITDNQVKNRGKFFEAAEKLFERYGYQKMTVQDVCKAANLSKPTFYDLFKDKSALFAEMTIDIAERMITEWHSSLPDGLDPVQMLNAFVDFYAHSFSRREIFRSIFGDIEAMEQFAKLIYQNSESPLMIELEQIILDGIGSLMFRRLNPETAIYMIYSLLDCMFFLFPILTGNFAEKPNPEFVDEIKAFLLNGVGANDG